MTEINCLRQTLIDDEHESNDEASQEELSNTANLKIYRLLYLYYGHHIIDTIKI